MVIGVAQVEHHQSFGLWVAVVEILFVAHLHHNHDESGKGERKPEQVERRGGAEPLERIKQVT